MHARAARHRECEHREARELDWGGGWMPGGSLRLASGWTPNRRFSQLPPIFVEIRARRTAFVADVCFWFSFAFRLHAGLLLPPFWLLRRRNRERCTVGKSEKWIGMVCVCVCVGVCARLPTRSPTLTLCVGVCGILRGTTFSSAAAASLCFLRARSAARPRVNIAT